MELHQPTAPAAQQQMRLESDWAVSSQDQSSRQCILDFPLPGSKAGPRDFRCFVTLPAGEGEFSIGVNQPARGFLLQEVGLRRGKTVFRSGTVRIEAPTLRPSRRTIELDVGCDDGTRITAKAELKSDGFLVQRFAQSYGPDIASLSQPSLPDTAIAGDQEGMTASPTTAETAGDAAGGSPQP